MTISKRLAGLLWGRLALGGTLTALLLLLGSSSAWGAGFTLFDPNGETYVHPKGTEITFLPIEFPNQVIPGNPQLVTLDPPFDPLTQDFFVFRVRVDGPNPIGNLTLESIAPFLFDENGDQYAAIGMGYLNTVDGVAPTGGSVQLFGINPQFSFTGDEIGLNEVSKPLIVTYALNSVSIDGNVAFMVQVDGQGNLSPEYPIIPEPHTAVLLGAGLLGLLATARRARSARAR